MLAAATTRSLVLLQFLQPHFDRLNQDVVFHPLLPVRWELLVLEFPHRLDLFIERVKPRDPIWGNTYLERPIVGRLFAVLLALLHVGLFLLDLDCNTRNL